MAPYIPFPGVLQANVRFTLDGQQIENVLNFDYGEAAFAGAAAAVAGALDLAWWDSMRVQFSGALVHQSVYITDLSSETGPIAVFPQFTNPAGAATGSAVPSNAALCVTHRTSARGRSYRGRTFMSGIAKSVVDNSEVSSGVVSDIVGAFNEMRVALAADDILFVVCSRQLDKAPRIIGQATPVTLSEARDNVIDSQRRRLPGRGN